MFHKAPEIVVFCLAEVLVVKEHQEIVCVAAVLIKDKALVDMLVAHFGNVGLWGKCPDMLLHLPVVNAVRYCRALFRCLVVNKGFGRYGLFG